MKKWTLLKNRITGERSARNNKTGQIIKETEQQIEYNKIRQYCTTVKNSMERKDLMTSLGLVKCKGAVSGKTYWE